MFLHFHYNCFIENSLITNRKKTALKVLTNTVQSIKKSDGEGLKPCFKQQKILKPMKIFEIETKSKSLQDNSLNEEFSHFDCTIQEKGNFITCIFT